MTPNPNPPSEKQMKYIFVLFRTKGIGRATDLPGLEEWVQGMDADQVWLLIKRLDRMPDRQLWMRPQPQSRPAARWLGDRSDRLPKRQV